MLSITSFVVVTQASSEELSLGGQQAPITIIEYGSLTCGKCLSFHRATYPELKKQFIDQGIVRFVYRHFPTDAAAAYGARAVNCAGDKYYEMLDKLFSTVGTWVGTQDRDIIFVRYATSLGLDSDDFLTCINDTKKLDEIFKHQQDAKINLDVTGTPTFFINDEIVRGKRSFDEMKALINRALENN